ncbi:MAG: porin PorA family protein [Aeromicrobium sp.]|uniref:porin PorA family protein n=1 Tax=Aeromicrobium sp. TaxID=1871063 RepID=UPI0039E47A8E
MAESHSKSSAQKPSGRGHALAILGLALMVLAALVVFVIAPKLTQLPGDFSSTVDYEGESRQLDPATLTLGDPVDVTATREVEVTETDGTTAIIASTSTAKLPSGENTTEKKFAVGRTDYEQIEGVDGVDDQKGGMVISHVRRPSTDAFTVYDATTDSAQLVEYVKTETIGGREAYYFEGQTVAPVKAEGTLEALRESVGKSMKTDGTVLPAATVAGFVADPPEGLDFDPAELAEALAETGDEVPAKYISTNTTKVWIDTEMGSPLQTGQEQTISLYAGLDGDIDYPLLDLNSLELMSDEEAVERLADTAGTNAGLIKLAEVYLPLGIAAIGLLLLTLGLLRSRRG